ncbi:MAG: hypothetical protein BWK75_07050 [Candidatus Altiarchaeales archaeon A3]|nr:MAG: hypothetical protein BWK75_07050 [Candidatus Altiarchaeales archaeon A3]
MKLPPGIRERKRYVIFKVISENSRRFSKEEILRGCLYAVHSFLGDNKMGDANIYLIDWNENFGLGILKTSHETKDEIVVALSLLSAINETKISVILLNTTGTIKKAKEIIMSLKSVENPLSFNSENLIDSKMCNDSKTFGKKDLWNKIDGHEKRNVLPGQIKNELEKLEYKI